MYYLISDRKGSTFICNLIASWNKLLIFGINGIILLLF